MRLETKPPPEFSFEGKKVFGLKSMAFMVVLSITLVVLPLLLPPLPPPPIVLMFVPVLVMSLLIMLVVSHKPFPDMM
ncbi:hypothetical protein RIF29_19819 [Crotalaria pallida]|uniref:Transmembrane protein n=1 Tax=Crotalaria pallida TaxID=3830 RepID=A0AAN9F2E6_CROPI